MFSLPSEKELRACFREIDQEEVMVPSSASFPIQVQDNLVWLEPSGARIYLVYQDKSFKSPFGIVFRRMQSVGPDVVAMCEWCHSVRTGNQIGMLSVATKTRHRAGISLCRDLSCVQNVRSGPGVNDFARMGTEEERVERVFDRITQLVRREMV